MKVYCMKLTILKTYVQLFAKNDFKETRVRITLMDFRRQSATRQSEHLVTREDAPTTVPARTFHRPAHGCRGERRFLVQRGTSDVGRPSEQCIR